MNPGCWEAGPVYEFEARLWRWRDDSAWHFVTLPAEISDDIDDRTPLRGGFGSVKVEVAAGGHAWRTSLFPSKEQGAFILPIKKSVRERLDCGEGDMIAVTLVIR